MSIILDLLVIAVILVTVVLSAKRGFVRTVIEAVGFIAAIIIAFTLSSPLASVTYDKIIEPSLVSAVEKVAGDGTQGALDATWNALPGFITDNADRIGLSRDAIAEMIQKNEAGGIRTAAVAASQNTVKPVASRLLSMMISVILMVVLLLVVKIVARFVNSLFSVSIVGKLNRTLGGAVGLVKGIVIAAALCMLIALLASFTENGFLIFTRETIGNSHLFRLLAGLAPFDIV